MNQYPSFYRAKDRENKLSSWTLLNIPVSTLSSQKCWPKVFDPCVGEGVGGASFECWYNYLSSVMFPAALI